MAQTKPILPPKITATRFKHLHWSSATGQFQADKRLQVQALDLESRIATTISADQVEYDQDAQFVYAHGHVQLEREDATLTGDDAQYNFGTRIGTLTNAVATGSTFRMEGKRIETTTKGDYVIIDGTFTTCIRNRPDYKIHAARLTVSPDKYVSGKNISLFLGNTKLITVPNYRRNLVTTSAVSTPLPAYSVTEGPVIRLYESPISKPNETVNYDISVNFRRLPAGFVDFQQDIRRQPANVAPPASLEGLYGDPLRGFLDQLLPPSFQDYTTNRIDEQRQPRTTMFGIVTNDQYVFNRRNDDLLVSRTPEVGIRFTNILGHAIPSLSPANRAEIAEGIAEPALTEALKTPLLLNVMATAGYLRETPTVNMTGPHVYGGRASIQTDLVSVPFVIGTRLSWRAGLTNWFNLYGTGTTYNLLSPQAELDYVPTRTSLISLGYRYMTDNGTTPFSFDRRDIRHEARLRYQVGGPWGFGVIGRYDLEKSRLYDGEFSILRNFDCMQVGVHYHVLSQSITLVFNLLPVSPNRAQHLRNPIVATTSTDPAP